MELEGNSNSATSAAFLRSATGGRARHPEPLTVIWDNSLAHRGDALRTYLTTPGLRLRLVNLPSYSPDFNAPIFDQSRYLGLGAPRGNRQCVPGNPCRSTGKGRRLFHPSGPPPARSQATMSHHPSGSCRRTGRQRPSRSSRPRKCRFHLGLGLGHRPGTVETAVVHRLDPVMIGLAEGQAGGVDVGHIGSAGFHHLPHSIADLPLNHVAFDFRFARLYHNAGIGSAGVRGRQVRAGRAAREFRRRLAKVGRLLPALRSSLERSGNPPIAVDRFPDRSRAMARRYCPDTVCAPDTMLLNSRLAKFTTPTLYVPAGTLVNV